MYTTSTTQCTVYMYVQDIILQEHTIVYIIHAHVHVYVHVATCMLIACNLAKYSVHMCGRTWYMSRIWADVAI